MDEFIRWDGPAATGAIPPGTYDRVSGEPPRIREPIIAADGTKNDATEAFPMQGQPMRVFMGKENEPVDPAIWTGQGAAPKPISLAINQTVPANNPGHTLALQPIQPAAAPVAVIFHRSDGDLMIEYDIVASGGCGVMLAKDTTKAQPVQFLPADGPLVLSVPSQKVVRRELASIGLALRVGAYDILALPDLPQQADD